MIQLTIESVVNACNGIIIRKGDNNYISGISTDTRKIQPEMLFVPLVGENYDGHDFIIDASKKGIHATLVEKNKKPTCLNELENIYVIEVENTVKALKDISKKYKESFRIPFIAVTGSNGKTSTKDMISAVLSSRFKALKSEGNFNNQIGLPLTLFNLDKSHEFAVLEMGMSSFGEIEELVGIVNPNIAVITNIGMAHIENLGSKLNIMKAKMEISKNLSEEDILLFNGDDEYLKSIKLQKLRYRAISFGMDKTNDFYPEKIYDLGDKGVTLDILINSKMEKFYIKQPGLHNVYNALVAIWVGLFYEMTPKEINKSLHSYIPTKMRMEIIENSNCKIINDCYNASPNSMKAALSVLANSTGNRKIAILANMLELGMFSEKGHRFVGKCVAENKIDILITVGEEAKWIADEAHNAGLEKKNMFKVGKIQEINLLLNEIIKQGDTILVKGSRSMQMENVVQLLLERC